jgi:hypothetical protein
MNPAAWAVPFLARAPWLLVPIGARTAETREHPTLLNVAGHASNTLSHAALALAVSAEARIDFLLHLVAMSVVHLATPPIARALQLAVLGQGWLQSIRGAIAPSLASAAAALQRASQTTPGSAPVAAPQPPAVAAAPTATPQIQSGSRVSQTAPAQPSPAETASHHADALDSCRWAPRDGERCRQRATVCGQLCEAHLGGAAAAAPSTTSVAPRPRSALESGSCGRGGGSAANDSDDCTIISDDDVIVQAAATNRPVVAVAAEPDAATRGPQARAAGGTSRH